MNKAIPGQEGLSGFYVDEALSVWERLILNGLTGNARLGAASKEIVVDAVRLEQLFARFGVPYSLKVDIEGADLVSLDTLMTSGARPSYVSIESNKTSWDDLVHEFELVSELGFHERRHWHYTGRFFAIAVCLVTTAYWSGVELHGELRTSSEFRMIGTILMLRDSRIALNMLN